MTDQFGALEPPDQKHTDKYPAAAVLVGAPELPVEHRLPIPTWHTDHEQAHTASCVGHAVAFARAIQVGMRCGNMGVRFDPIDLWHGGRLRDEHQANDNLAENHWGTTARAVLEHTVKVGPRRVDDMRVENGVPVPVNPGPSDLAFAPASYRWLGVTRARRKPPGFNHGRALVDEMRSALAINLPVLIATGWRAVWSKPVRTWDRKSWQFPARDKWGPPGEGHEWTITGYSDTRRAFLCHNQWTHSDWGHVWLPYLHIERIEVEAWRELVVMLDAT